MVKKAIHAIYENGMLRPLSPLSLREGETVIISLEENQKEPELLELAKQVYQGLSAEEVNEIEKIALDRKDFFGER